MARDEHHDDGAIAPSVIGPSFVSDVEDVDPVLAYLPSERAYRGETKVTVELRRTNDDRLAVLAYSSLDALVTGCGERQPWVSMPVGSVSMVAKESGANLVLWDPVLPAKQRRVESNGEGG